jgi:formate/nitrite transporter FocA (FNT family)
VKIIYPIVIGGLICVALVYAAMLKQQQSEKKPE